MRRLYLALVLLLVGAGVAQAQDFDAAGRHFAAGQEAFTKRHYRTAAWEFQNAYNITKDPVLLYNVAESFEKAGDGHRAAAAYEQYRRALPKATDRGEVARRIARIKSLGYALPDQSAADAPAAGSPPAPTPSLPPARETAPPAPTTRPESPSQNQTLPWQPSEAAPPAPAAVVPTTPTTPPTTSTAAPSGSAAPPGSSGAPGGEPAPPPGLLEEGPMSHLRVAAWVGVATTVAVLTAGAILGLAAQSRSDEISRRLNFVDSTGAPHAFDAATQSELKNLRDEGNLYNGLAIGFYAAAGAAAIATAAMFTVDIRRGPAKQALRLSPVLGLKQAGLAAGWAF